MCQTLFHIPHTLFGLPVFGFGWLFGLWLLLSVGLLAWLWRKQGLDGDTLSYLPVLATLGLAIVVVLPFLEVNPEQNLGIPIRGYGVMLLAGVVAGVGLAAHRAQQVGVDVDTIFSLAFWSFVSGIVGARTFFVIQYWPQFRYGEEGPLGTWETLAKIVNVAEGGLVVYGSLIFALLGIIGFIYVKRLPGLALLDLIAPAMALGLALGRIGCLMNGCCFGGVSDLPWAITFPDVSNQAVDSPPPSPPYANQQSLGLFYGIRVAPDDKRRPVVAKVEPNSPAAEAGVQPDDVIVRIWPTDPKRAGDVETWEQARQALSLCDTTVRLEMADGRQIEWSVAELPARSLPVHPTQIYSAINASLLCLFLLAYYPFRRRDGEVIALTLGLYAIARFLLEIIRNDEVGGRLTGLTISQTLSLVMIAAAIGLWFDISRRPAGTLWGASARSEQKVGVRESAATR